MEIHNDLSTSNFETYLEAAEQSLQDKNWVSALNIALTLPGVCSNIDPCTKKLHGDAKKYQKWYQNNVDASTSKIVKSATLPYIEPAYDAESVYRLRCSMLHEGQPLTTYFNKRFGSSDNHVAVLICVQDKGETPTFVSTSTGGFVGQGINIYDGPYEIEVTIFVKELCQKLIDSSRAYYNANRQEFENFKGLFNWNY